MIPNLSSDGKNQEARQKAILELLRQYGTLTLQELADTFSCSLATIRRDLHELQAQEPGLRRYHGAVGIEANAGEQWFADKSAVFATEKDAIAEVIVRWLPDHITIGLNGGTTTTRIAWHLAQAQKPVTVVTNAINIAYQLAQANIAVVVIGGDLRPYNYETTGTLALDGLERLHLDWAVLGANGIHSQVGITTAANEEAVLGQAFRRAADQIMIAVDHSKFHRNALYQMLEWTDVDYLATDAQASAWLQEWPDAPTPVATGNHGAQIWAWRKTGVGAP